MDLLPNEGQGGTSSQPGESTAAGGSVGTVVTSSGGAGTSLGTNGLPVALIHRYDFEGTGTEVVDRAGFESGVVVGGAALNGNGQLTITDGVSYVKLPSWLIKNAKSSSITFAIWFTLDQSEIWARIFDFGATNEGTDQPGTAIAQFYFTPNAMPYGYYSVLLNNDCNAGAQAIVEPPATFPTGAPVYVAVVVEGDEILGTSTLRLYLNGTAVEAPSIATVAQRLTEFTDQHCWLGLSQWTQDNSTNQHFYGSYDEFRIYSRALSAVEVANLSLTDPTIL